MFCDVIPSYAARISPDLLSFIPGEYSRKMLDNPLLIRWFGKNANIEHPKLDSLPIGLKRHNFRQGFESFLR